MLNFTLATKELAQQYQTSASELRDRPISSLYTDSKGLEDQVVPAYLCPTGGRLEENVCAGINKTKQAGSDPSEDKVSIAGYSYAERGLRILLSYINGMQGNTDFEYAYVLRAGHDPTITLLYNEEITVSKTTGRIELGPISVDLYGGWNESCEDSRKVKVGVSARKLLKEIRGSKDHSNLSVDDVLGILEQQYCKMISVRDLIGV